MVGLDGDGVTAIADKVSSIIPYSIITYQHLTIP